MTKTIKTAFAAAIALTSLATPATAQVAGIATSRPAVVIASSKARNDAFAQIETAFSAQIQLIQQLDKEMAALGATLDTNKDQNLSQEEANANPTVYQQLQAKDQQVSTLTQPIALAQYYVIEQLLNDYGNARQQVINDKGIQIMLSREAIEYAPEAVDVTSAIVAALDKRMPSVSTTVPANWQPRQSTVQMFQAVQQVLAIAAQAQQAAASRQQQGGAAPQQPAGR